MVVYRLILEEFTKDNIEPVEEKITDITENDVSTRSCYSKRKTIRLMFPSEILRVYYVLKFLYVTLGRDWSWFEHHFCLQYVDRKSSRFPAFALGPHLMIMSQNVVRFCWRSPRRSASRHSISSSREPCCTVPHCKVEYHTVYKQYILLGQNVCPCPFWGSGNPFGKRPCGYVHYKCRSCRKYAPIGRPSSLVFWAAKQVFIPPNTKTIVTMPTSPSSLHYLLSPLNTFNIWPYREKTKAKELEKTEIDKTLKMNIIELTQSKFASPNVLDPKMAGIQICVDYCWLIFFTLKDAYPMTWMEECIHSLGEARIFTTLNAIPGYFQIQIDECNRTELRLHCIMDYIDAFACCLG